MSDYPAGTVAVATVRGVPNVRVFRRAGGWWSVAERGPSGETFAYDKAVTDVRPLVVLNLNEQSYRRVIEVLRENGLSIIAGLIERQTRPPKPEEPTGLGAVVEDAEGKHFVRIPDGDDCDVWFDNRGDFFSWGSIAVVRVLSEGVQP